jgi:hypothetical protein
VGVDRAAGDPQPAAFVPRHLDGLFDHGVGGEQVQLVAIGQVERLSRSTGWP